MHNKLHTAYIGIGSNLGNRRQYLDTAVLALGALADGRIRCSGVYETAPVLRTDQPDFLNLVAELHVPLRPLDLLRALHDIEQANGRVRTVRFGPRTLDLDILIFDDDYVCFQNLQVPHPRMWERAFVLIPLAELAPLYRGLGGRTIVQMAALHTGEGIRYVGRFW